MKIKPGAVLNGRYEILAEIGEGGFATVYKGRDLQLNRELAIKVVKTSGLGESMARFQREAKLLGSLSHRNIVSVYSFDLLDDQTPFIAMEYLQGKSLLQLIGEKGALEFVQLKSIMLQVCAALAYAHKAGAIHRDLSPANIFLVGDDADPVVKILDFGLSRIFGETAGAALTTTGMLVGNPPYMSPEQARGTSLDHSSDIYSIGCVFYECFTGKCAFASDSLISVLALQQTEYPKFPENHWKNLEEQELLKSILLRCLQKEPSKRFQSCDAIIHALTEGNMPDGTPIDKDLHPWSSGGGKNRNNTSKQNVKIAVVGALLVLCLVAAIFKDRLFSSLIFVETSLNLPFLAGLEQSQADSFLRTQNVASAAALYQHAGKLYSDQHESYKSISCGLNFSECLLRQGNKSVFKNEMRRILAEIAPIPDSKEKALLLSRFWLLLKDAVVLKGEEVSFVQLQDSTLKLILASKYRDKTELRKFFASFLATLRPFRENRAVIVESMTRACIRFLGNAPINFSNTNTAIMDSLAAACQTTSLQSLYVELQLARISAAEFTGEEISRIQYQMACDTDNPDKALKLLQQAKHGPDTKTKVYLLATVEEARILLYKKHSYLAALKSCVEGIAGSRGEIYNEKTLCPLYSIKVVCLYKLGRQKEMLEASGQMLQGLWQGGGKDDLPMEALNRLVSVEEHQEALFTFQKNWCACLHSLIITKQTALAKSEVIRLTTVLKKKDYRFNPLVVDNLRSDYESCDDASLKELINQLIHV